MDDLQRAISILRTYSEFTNIRSEDDTTVSFLYMDRRFHLYPVLENETEYPVICVEGDDSFGIPHIMPTSTKDGFRYVCLRQGEYINFLSSFEEKIRDVCGRLISLMTLSDSEKEEEFHREFVFYWNAACKSSSALEIYIGDKDGEFGSMNAYSRQSDGRSYGERLVKSGVRLNDREKDSETSIPWMHHSEIAAVYIPLMSINGLMPPTKDATWTQSTLNRIMVEQHEIFLSPETYEKISNTKAKGDALFVTLGIPVGSKRECCSFIIHNRRNTKVTILDWLRKRTAIELIMSIRSDYSYLCKVIGNDISINKNFLVVGAGSLGSYVCKELVKAGVRHLSVYDEDKLDIENSFRWDCRLRNPLGSFFGYYKVDILKKDLELIHPEIIIDAYHEKLTAEELGRICTQFDILIFTVGSSDFQYLANRELKETGYKGWAVYVWLEPGGNYSHILSVNYAFPGCYQCLFTDTDGKLSENRYNLEHADNGVELIMTNACGGTRAAYGNAVLLRTSAAFLGQLKGLLSGHRQENSLVDITPSEIVNHGSAFRNKLCKCCGDSDGITTD